MSMLHEVKYVRHIRNAGIQDRLISSSELAEERVKNKKTIKSFLRCAYFLEQQHIAYTKKFKKLVELIVSCGSEDLKTTATERNSTYTTSYVAVVLGVQVEECLLR